MWTPRRVLLLLGGLLLSAGVYGVYARFVGWLDGLPQLPARMLNSGGGGVRPPERPTSPTILRLREAFGPDCPEQLATFYPTQLEFWSNGTSVVLASGSPPFNNGSNRVVLTPFSLAVFGKPKPEHLRQPGEVTEISTFHADKAILEFDRPIGGPADMNRAKLVRMELVSEPESALPDPRRGVIHITNNQRSADPHKFLVMRTVGPVFYRDPKGIDPQAAAGPDIWTDAAVELVDRGNLPRGYGVPAPPTAPSKGPELLKENAVPDILAGRRFPPPTLTGVGLRIYFEPEPPPGAPPKPRKAGGPGGLRRVELQEKVLINLWVDGRQQIGANTGRDEPTGTAGGPAPTTGPGPGAVIGGVFFGTQDAFLLNRALVQVDTHGSLHYDAVANLAHFEAGPETDPNLPNDVQVHRLAPTGAGAQRLFCQKFDIEFNGPATGTQGADPPAPRPEKGKSATAGTPSFKRLSAWVESPGRILTLVSDVDRLEAYGRRLDYDQAADRTLLEGAPLVVKRDNPPRPDKKAAGSHVLHAGTPHERAVLVIESGPGPERKKRLTVKGRGRLELFDPATNANTIHASWLTSLAQTTETVNRLDLTLLTFTDGAVFEDKRADYWLKGKVIKLWMQHGAGAAIPDAARERDVPARSVPNRLHVVGAVTGHSAEFDIEQADHLNVLFRDSIPPLTANVGPPAPPPAAPSPQVGPPSPGRPAAAAPPPPAEPAKPKPAMKIRARAIDTWVVRYSVPAAPGGRPPSAGQPAGRDDGSVKYELEKARCEGPYTVDGKESALVHQDPAEPAPDKRGVDIYGQTMLLDHTPDGSVLTVIGADDRRPGQVHHEGMSIIGPKVAIDQLHNSAEVEGRGSLVLPANSDLGGTELKQPSVVVIHWRDAMKFRGATKLAEFFGKVTAQQNESTVTCHILQVQFDRPVDFTPRRKAAPATPAFGPRDPRPAGRPGGGPAERENPKIEVVRCYPAPDEARDEPKGASVVTYTAVTRDESGQIAKTQHVTARDLEMTSRPLAPGSKDAQHTVRGTGPGTVRIWQPGEKDVAQPEPTAAGPATPTPAGKPAKDSEMKLTVVQFAGRMQVVDRGKVYQEATFHDTIEVIHSPADKPDAAFDRYRLPAGAVHLTCATQLVVSEHKRPNSPTALRLDAVGNAYIRSDEYEGSGETITSDGPTVTLKGGPNALAVIRNRFNRTENPGKEIVYNRTTGAFKVDGSPGGTIQGSSRQPPPPPPKKKER